MMGFGFEIANTLIAVGGLLLASAPFLKTVLYGQKSIQKKRCDFRFSENTYMGATL